MKVVSLLVNASGLPQQPQRKMDPQVRRGICLINKNSTLRKLKKMKNELNAAKRSKPEKLSDPEPEFSFEGNKNQYKVNQNVLEKISEAPAFRR